MYTLIEAHLDNLNPERLSALCDEYTVVVGSLPNGLAASPRQEKRLKIQKLHGFLSNYQIFFEPCPSHNVSDKITGAKLYFYKGAFGYVPGYHKEEVVKAKAFLYLTALAFKYAEPSGSKESDIICDEIKNLSFRSGLPENQLYSIWLSALEKSFIELKRPLYGARKFINDYQYFLSHVADVATADGVLRKKEVWFYKVVYNIGLEDDEKIDSKASRKLLKSHAGSNSIKLLSARAAEQHEQEFEQHEELIEDLLQAFEV